MTIACRKDYSINVSVCDATTDWTHNPGSCRLRIAEYDPADWTNSALCFDARLGAIDPWDGTFSVPTPAGPLIDFYVDQVLFTTCGGVYFGAVGGNRLSYNTAGVRWELYLNYMTNGFATGGRWSGRLAGTSPIGIYALFARCNVGLPLTVEIEAYSV